jgi:hypothetical protein
VRLEDDGEADAGEVVDRADGAVGEAAQAHELGLPGGGERGSTRGSCREGLLPKG